jgi:hypothetical protein
VYILRATGTSSSHTALPSAPLCINYSKNAKILLEGQILVRYVHQKENPCLVVESDDGLASTNGRTFCDAAAAKKT